VWREAAARGDQGREEAEAVAATAAATTSAVTAAAVKGLR